MKRAIKKELTQLLKPYSIVLNNKYKENCVVDMHTLTYKLRVTTQGMPVLLMGEIFSVKYGGPTMEIYFDNIDCFNFKDVNFQNAIQELLGYLQDLYMAEMK